MRDFYWFSDFVPRWAAAQGRTDAYLDPVLRFERIQADLLGNEHSASAARDCKARLQEHPVTGDRSMDAFYPRLGAQTRLAAYGCNIPDVVRLLTTGGALPELPPGPAVTLLCTREPGKRALRFIRINDQTRDLLQLCDGSRSTGAVIASIARDRGRDVPDEALAQGCRRILVKMADLFMVVFTPSPHAPEENACVSVP
jgi:hypothetical protein